MPFAVLDHFKFKVKLFSATDIAQIKLPELAREAKRRPVLIQIGDQLQTYRPPEVGQADIRAHRFQFDCGVERKRCALGHEACEGITVELIAMSWIGSPVRVRVMRRDNSDAAAGLRDPMQFSNEHHHVRHMLDDVTANDLIEFAIGEGIRHDAQIVNHVCLRTGIRIDSDRARMFVLAAANIEDLGGCWGSYRKVS